MSIENTKTSSSTRDTAAHQNIITILLDLIAVSWLILFLVCSSMRSPFFSRRKIMYNFMSSVSIFLLFDCQLSFRRFDMTLINIDFSSLYCTRIHRDDTDEFVSKKIPCKLNFFFFPRKFQFLCLSLSLWK